MKTNIERDWRLDMKKEYSDLAALMRRRGSWFESAPYGDWVEILAVGLGLAGLSQYKDGKADYARLNFYNLGGYPFLPPGREDIDNQLVFSILLP